MARRARIGSRYNLYHVVLKGINRQIIFEEQKDYFSFLRVLEEYIEEGRFRLHAEAIEKWKVISGLENPQDLQKMDILSRDRELYQMVKNKIPVRQISRITGISRTSIRRIVERMKEEETGAL